MSLSDGKIRNVFKIIVDDPNMTVEKAAADLGVTRQALYYRFDALGLGKPESKRVEERNRQIWKKKTEGYSIEKLREEYNLSKPSIYAILRSQRDLSTQRRTQGDKKKRLNKTNKTEILELELPNELYEDVVSIAKFRRVEPEKLVTEIIQREIEHIKELLSKP